MCVFCARWSGTGQQNAWGHSPAHFYVDFQHPTWRKLWLLSKFMSLPRCLVEGSLGPFSDFPLIFRYLFEKAWAFCQIFR